MGSKAEAPQNLPKSVREKRVLHHSGNRPIGKLYLKVGYYQVIIAPLPLRGPVIESRPERRNKSGGRK